jgi:hypothetical protein
MQVNFEYVLTEYSGPARPGEGTAGATGSPGTTSGSAAGPGAEVGQDPSTGNELGQWGDWNPNPAVGQRFEYAIGVSGGRPQPQSSVVFTFSDAEGLGGAEVKVTYAPFSHAAEKELLPSECSHETMTVKLIESFTDTLNSLTPPIRAVDVAKVAVGPKVSRDQTFNAWEEVLSEIITDDALGADRMDYLLRDSHHLGVAYGHFDLPRLVSEIRVLPRIHGSKELALGLEEGGCHAAEGLQLARYFMYTQVYFHPVRRSYDMLLKEYLLQWRGGPFSTDLASFLALTDNEVLAAIRLAVADKDQPGHETARRFCQREHYRRLYAWNARDARQRPDIVEVIYQEAAREFGATNLRLDSYPAKDSTVDFPVRLADGRVVSSASVSDVFSRVPPAKFAFVFVAPDCVEAAARWLENIIQTILPEKGGLTDESVGAQRHVAGSNCPA